MAAADQPAVIYIKHLVCHLIHNEDQHKILSFTCGMDVKFDNSKTYRDANH